MIANDVALSVKNMSIKENVTVMLYFYPYLRPPYKKRQMMLLRDKIDLRMVSKLVFLLITLNM